MLHKERFFAGMENQKLQTGEGGRWAKVCCEKKKFPLGLGGKSEALTSPGAVGKERANRTCDA